MTDTHGRTLLDPTRVSWASCFALEDDRLVAAAGNGAAAYTRDAYGVNDPRRMAMRKYRREGLGTALRALAERGKLEPLLMKPGFAELARQFREYLRIAEDTVLRFRIVSVDAPDRCSCDAANACSLSTNAREQGVRAPS